MNSTQKSLASVHCRYTGILVPENGRKSGGNGHKTNWVLFSVGSWDNLFKYCTSGHSVCMVIFLNSAFRLPVTVYHWYTLQYCTYTSLTSLVRSIVYNNFICRKVAWVIYRTEVRRYIYHAKTESIVKTCRWFLKVSCLFSDKNFFSFTIRRKRKKNIRQLIVSTNYEASWKLNQ